MVDLAVAKMMPDGRRLHLQHGPIDLVCFAEGDPIEVQQAYMRAAQFFQDILQSIVNDLALLRRPITDEFKAPTGAISAAMMKASQLFADTNFVTPMASVAGAVSDAVLAVMTQSGRVEKAVVNNGGDIAFALKASEKFTSAIVNNPDNPNMDAILEVDSSDPVRGVATSGWKGRSFSMGIADAVTVLASNAAIADVAATLIANAVFVEDNAIIQKPACEVDANTDLGDNLITVEVGQLTVRSKKQALRNGVRIAKIFADQELIYGAYLALQDEVAQVSLQKNFIRENAVCLN